MARDVKMWKEDGSFKLRVCGIIQHGDKYLINNCDLSPFWSFTGGHVELGESSEAAVLREIKEELGVDTRIKKFLAVIELFFKREDNMPFHEIGFYYLLDPITKMNFDDHEIEEDDKGQKRIHKFKWVTLDEFKKYDVRPINIQEILKNNSECQHIIRIQD